MHVFVDKTRLKPADLIANDCLLNSSQILEWLQQHMHVLGPSNQRCKVAQLLCERHEHFVFIIDRICELLLV